MKTKLSILLVLIVTLHSCVTTKTYSTEEKKMRDAAAGVYILKANGEKITGKKITYPSAFNIKPDFLKIDDRKIAGDEIVAYQDKNGYHTIFDRHGESVSITQLKRGAINLYYYETATTRYSASGKNSTDYNEHFVFEKKSAGLELAELSITDIASILKDNQKAYDTFTARFGSKDKKFLPKQLDKDPKVLFDAIDIYNGNK